MTETIVIVSLVAIATIGVVGLYGDNIRAIFGASSSSLAGDAKVKSGAMPGWHATQAKNLCNFGMNASVGFTTFYHKTGGCGSH